MLSILGAVLFGVIATMTVLVACGLPLGEFTMGGQQFLLCRLPIFEYYYEHDFKK